MAFDTSIPHGTVKSFNEEAFVSTFDALLHTCYSWRMLLAHCMYTMNSWYTSVQVHCALIYIH